MYVSRTLPEGYVLGGTITLAGNRALKRRLTLLALPWLAVSLVATFCFGGLLRPRGWSFALGGTPPLLGLVYVLVGVIASFVVAMVLHEAAHGVVLWVLTRARPVFGFKGWYLYTDAPGWFLSRSAMVVVLVAPLFLLPLLAIPVIRYAPDSWSLLTLLLLIWSAAGSIGDLYLLSVAVRIRGPVCFGDAEGAKTGESGSWFVPASSGV